MGVKRVHWGMDCSNTEVGMSDSQSIWGSNPQGFNCLSSLSNSAAAACFLCVCF